MGPRDINLVGRVIKIMVGERRVRQTGVGMGVTVCLSR